MPVNLITPEGQTVSVPEEAVAAALERGFKVESGDQGIARAAHEGELADYQGVNDTARAFAGSALSAATLGVSDILGATRDDMLAREAHPIASTIGTVGGAVIPSLLAPGEGALASLSRLTPTGQLSNIASRIVASGAEKGLIKKVGASVAAGALEGGVQNAGMYLADAALQDKPLSAEAFVGAMGHGALFGGAIGGGLSIGESALVRAKKLYPKQQISREAAETTAEDARAQLTASIADSKEMERIAREKTAAARAAKGELDAAFKAEQANIKAAFQQQKAAAAVAKKEADALAAAKAGKNLKVAVPGDQDAIEALNAEAAAARAQSEAYVATKREAESVAKASKPLKGNASTRAMFKRMGGDPKLAAASYVDEAEALDDGLMKAYRAQRGVAEAEPIDDGLLRTYRAQRAASAPEEAEDGLLRTYQAQRRAGEPVPAADEMTDLERQLAGTKARLDQGESLASVGEDAGLADKLDDTLAAADPEAAKIIEAERAVRMSRQDVEAWVEKYRNPNRSYVDSDGGARKGISPRKMDRIEAVADETPEQAVARLEALRTKELGRPSLGKQILEGKVPDRYMALSADEILDINYLDDVHRASVGVDIDDMISKALKSKPVDGDVTEDLAEAIDLIGKHEEASAKLADLLGIDAPPAATRRAAEFAEAMNEQGRKMADQAGNLAETLGDAETPVDPLAGLRQRAEATKAEADAAKEGVAAAKGKSAVARAKISEIAAAEKAEARRMAVGNALDVASVVEVLSSFGAAGIPNVDSIPVIGPVLGLWLKARAVGMVFRRLGGKVPVTAETKIASKAAETRQRVANAVDKALDASSKSVRRVQAPARSAAGILSHSLFSEDGAKQTRVEPKSKDAVYKAFDARMDELVRAQQTGAVQAAIRRTLRPSDPDLEAALVGAAERKLAFLAKVAPRNAQLPNLLKGDGDWKPSRAQLEEFARYVHAAEDPASVLEDLADGDVLYPEGAEVLREVYPSLFREAQMQLLTRSQEMQAKLPYARRVALSILFQVPVDGTVDADYFAFLSGPPVASGGQGGAPAAAPAPGAPPSPTIAGPVDMGSAAMTSLDRRAGV